jgi:hypothetical protein
VHGGSGDDQRLGVGVADIFCGADDDPSGNEFYVLAGSSIRAR